MNKDIGGVQLHYIKMGNGGNKVLLLHGWGCDISLMEPVGKALADSHDILIPDLPGHGQSGRPPVPWGVPEYAENILLLLQENDFTPCDVIAHSFGCRIAAWIAVHHPDAIKKIVFTGAAGIRPKQTEEAKKRSRRFQRGKAFAQKIGTIPLLSGAAEKMQQKLREKYGSRDYNELDEEMRKTFVKIIKQDLTDLYEHFSQSTLLIWGDKDTETPLWMAKEMEKRIPDCGLVILENGSHFAYLDQLTRFNSIVRFFLTEA